ncbi:MAG: hypothetical protein ACXV8Q_03995 [Methylobacter sp.]
MKPLRLWLALVLTGLLSLFSGIVNAKDGRDFAGHYAITNVVKSPNSVSLTLNLQFFNYSNSTITGAVVSLEDPLLAGKSLGQLGIVDLANHAEAKLSGNFVLLPSEYAIWTQGASPKVSVAYVNNQGEDVRRFIELTPMPMLFEGMQP